MAVTFRQTEQDYNNFAPYRSNSEQQRMLYSDVRSKALKKAMAEVERLPKADQLRADIDAGTTGYVSLMPSARRLLGALAQADRAILDRIYHREVDVVVHAT
jgi:hypothetical protein